MGNKKKAKKKKRRKSASSMMALVTDDAPQPLVSGAIIASKPKVRPESEWRRVATCGICLKPNQPIAITDCDDGWELPGHPDHIDRDICVGCAPESRSRDLCAALVYAAMRKQLRTKEFSDHEVEQAVHIAWRTFEVDFDHKALVKMARKLKVKHPWLKGKKAK